MSKGIRYDSLLVRHLADELRPRLVGRVPRCLRLDAGARRFALELDDESLLWELHPERGWCVFLPPPPAATRIDFHRRATIADVLAPPDERLLIVDIRAPAAATSPRRLVVELMTNQWNLLGLDDDGRIRSALWRRDAGARSLRPGAIYATPPAARRDGAEAPLEARRWREILRDVAPGDRARRLVAGIAWTSPLNAAWILGAAAEHEAPEAVDAAYVRYRGLAPPAAARPVLLPGARRGQPYSHPLGTRAADCDSLLDAMARAADLGPVPVTAPEASPELIARLERRARRTERRHDRLRAELDGAAPEARRLRASADLLLAQAHAVPRGATRATLSDFAGGSVEVELDPALGAVENAQKLYEEARRRERAAERLPRLVARARSEAERLEALVSAAQRGEADAADVEAAVGGAARAADSAAEPTLPYRRFRTSGGLEVRVGRGARSNDELTFHHSDPEDIWLHARDVAGAHVIVRWGRRDANPPARDLAEAATLAALRSRARSSGTVAVDWTRRKYVRKPRKSPPGRVVADRLKTLFVEPREELEQRLRDR